MNRKKVLIGVGVVVVLGALAYANLAFKRTSGVQVTVEKIDRRNLEAQVQASGTIEPKDSVDISADTVGKVVDLAVDEGDEVTKGQFLLQIDPRNLETAVQNQQASLASAESTLEETKQSVATAKLVAQLAQADADRQANLWKKGLATREAYETAQNTLAQDQTNVARLEQSIKTQQATIAAVQAMLDSAKYDLTKVRITSPLTGLVTRRNITEGETVVTGTMNNAGTVLLTVADMSVIQAQVQVDETDIPSVKIGQVAAVTIDAVPNQTFYGKVTEVGNSPIQATGAASTTRATDFQVNVTLDHPIKGVRPGFTCTATITTATRQNVVSVPIEATTVRERIIDAEGDLVPQPPTRPGAPPAAAPSPADLRPGQSIKEIDGVFLVKDGHAAFTPIKIGITGDKYFEVLTGLREGDQVITGPFSSVRTLKDGDAVQIAPAAGAVGGAGSK